MPLLKPDIQRVLQNAGLVKERSDNDIVDILDEHNLDKQSLLRKLSDISEDAQNDHTKLRALELAFKLHGLLKDQPPVPTTVNIVINDPSEKSNKVVQSVNPILIPRQLN